MTFSFVHLINKNMLCTHTETFVYSFVSLPLRTFSIDYTQQIFTIYHPSMSKISHQLVQKVNSLSSCIAILFQFQNSSLLFSLQPSTTFSYFHQPVFYIVLSLRTGEYILLPLLVQAVSTTKAPRKMLH